MQAVILAGGNGTRLRPIAADVPKPMLPLFDQPVMEHTIKLLASHHITDIIVCTSRATCGLMYYFGDGSRWGVKIRYSIEHEPRGTAGALKLVQRMINGTFLVVSGDAVTDFDLSEAIARHKASCALATILTYEADEPTQYGVVQHDAYGRVTNFIEKPRTSELRGNIVSTGIYVLEPDAMGSIPYDEPSEFALHVFPRLLTNQEPVYSLSLRGYWCDVGGLLSYRKVHFDAITGHLKLDLPAVEVSEGLWLGERAQVHPSAVIESPVYIGAGATVKRGAILHGKTIIGDHAIVDEGAELSHCVIGMQSHVGRSTFVEDSILGHGCSVANDELVDNQLLISEPIYGTHTDQPDTAPSTSAPRAKSPTREAADIHVF